MVAASDTSSVFQALEDEDARLSVELERDSQYQRTIAILNQIPAYRQRVAVRDSIQSLRIAYAYQSAAIVRTVSPTEIVRTKAVILHKGSRENSISNLVSTAMEKQFRETGKRAGSAAALSHVTQLGIRISNKKPQNQVASILSHDPRFDNKSDAHGVGYGLAEWSAPDSGREISEPEKEPTAQLGGITSKTE